MKKKSFFGVCVFIVFWGFFVLLVLSARQNVFATDLPKKKVLYISSYHIGMPWQDRVWSGLKAGLSSRKDIDLFIEFMDSKRFPHDKVFNLCYMTMKTKYDGFHFDVIITSDDNALQFIKDYGEELFPGVPVVFCGVNETTLHDIKEYPHIIGVEEYRDVKGGIRLALQLHPSVKRIFIIIDKTISGEQMRKTVEEVVTQFPQITFMYPDNMSFSQMLEAVSTLPKDSLVMMLFYSVDANGTYIDNDDMVKYLVESAHVPLYLSSDINLGNGFIGGMVTSAYYQGFEAGKLAVRILSGQDRSSFPQVLESPNKLIFDYPALIKAGLSPDRLPGGSIVINRPVSFYDKYKKLIWGAGGAFIGVCIVVIIMGLNILQRKRAQHQLAVALDELEVIFDNTQAGIVLLNSERKIWRSNQRMADIFGFDSPKDMLGLSSRELHISDENFTHFATDYLSRLKRGENIKVEYPLKRRDGAILWGRIAGTVLSRNPPGLHKGALFIVDDITDRKEAEMALEKLNVQLEKIVQERTQALANQALELQIANNRLKTLDKEKSSMLSSVSHDLRTPLTSIRGFVKLISKSFKKHFLPFAANGSMLYVKANTIIGNLDIIDYESKRLTRLINDFLDLAKIESGRVLWRDSVLELEPLIIKSLDSVSGQFAARPELDLEVNIKKELPPVWADGDRIMQVLVNLLNNAAKHTTRGKVAVSLDQYGDNSLLVTISDTGSGIPKEYLKRIFDKFYQVETENTVPESGKGSGLGLSICHEIITHYNGKIWAESEYGIGSTFFFTLPIFDSTLNSPQ